MKRSTRVPVPADSPHPVDRRQLSLPAGTGPRARSNHPAYDATGHLRQWLHEGLQGMPRHSAILALGCEQAFLAPQLTEYAADVTVLDTSAAQIAPLARRFPEVAFQQHRASQPLPFAHDTFDAIWCCEFLDRVFDPATALREMHRVLVPGGRLLVTVPDRGPVRQLLATLFQWEEAGATALPRIHHFAKSTLALLAREAGWTEIQVSTSGVSRKVGGALVARSLRLAAKKGLGVQWLRVAERDQDRPEGNRWDELVLAGRELAA